MTESVQTTGVRPRGGWTLPAAIAGRRYPLAVGAVTLSAAAFLLHQLLAWPPHEDETLALFVGRYPLDQLFQVVLEERGGAPLHFVLAWAVAHLGFGLEGLRVVSAAFAVGSLPIVAALAARLTGRRQALVATVLVAASWTFLFHGVYGRMYSLFLFTSALAYLFLLRALERGDRRAWSLWALAILATVATHPYGAMVLATQVLFVLLARRDRLRQALLAFAAVGVLGIPFWLTDFVLAGRFDVGVGAGGERLGGPLPVFAYLWHVLGDFTTGWWPLLILVAALGALGLRRLPRPTVLLTAAVVVVPTLAFLAARFGSATSPETRHLIFVLPFAALAIAAGIVRLRRLAPIVLAALVVAQLTWAWQKTPPLFEWEPDARQAARADASAYLAATSLPDDVLFGFEPLYLGAWERNHDFPLAVLPRADANLALSTLLDLERPLGRGVWILDASEPNNAAPALEIDLTQPRPERAFEVRRFGPFLVIRTAKPTRTPKRYLERAGAAILVGKSLWIGDADINLLTIDRAARALRGYGADRSLSTSSR
ncbi:MAG: glycosyltransferase family 39 protein [Gaiellaceae bacterium MAG52_C11]|nr:glycosyltransferase family 39 protein [Candidatus Gaiellasilicea maunaloa]